MRIQHSFHLSCLLGVATTLVHAIDLNVSSADSVLAASKTIAQNILGIYNSVDILVPGLFPEPYYWWEGGLAFNSLLKYWAFSGDDSVVQTIQDGLLWQVGDGNGYMPANQSKDLGNADQAYWAHAAMTAAETDFPTRDNQTISWLQLAQNVFDEQVARWDDSSCDGGLRWQIFPFNLGYNYKNADTQGSFVALAARLARYTSNSTYGDWAQKATQWSIDVGLIDLTSNLPAVYDGTSTTGNCSEIDRIQWTSNIGLFLDGSAYMLNTTNAPFWNNLAVSLVNGVKAFLDDGGILVEVACAPSGNCNTDQLAYRAPLARALANVRDLASASGLTQHIDTIVQGSAMGAAGQCSGGSKGSVCGSDWTTTLWDGSEGLGQDLSALEIILANLPTRQLASATVSSVSNVANASATAADNNATETNATGTNPAAPSSTTGGAAQLLASYSMLGSIVIVGVVGMLL